MDAMTLIQKLEPLQKKLYSLNLHTVKRRLPIAAALVAFVILLCVLLGGNKNLVRSFELPEADLPTYGLQDPRAWGQGEVSLSDSPKQMDGYRIYKYKLSTQVLEEYIALLQGHGFTLVDEYHQSSFLGSYQSYGLLMEDAQDIKTKGLMYTDTPCHISIWKDDSKWWLEVCDGIDLTDLGLRRDGSEGDPFPQGESVEAGLKLKNNKRYETKDGRLKTKKGEAVVVCDGEETTAQVSWKRSGKKITVTMDLGDDRTAQIVYYEDKVKQGDVLLIGTVQEKDTTFTFSVGDARISATQTGKPAFENVTLRFMYLGDDGEVVLYLYARPLDGEKYPQQIEILCAINTTPAESSSSGSSGGGFNWGNGNTSYKPDHSKQDCLTCGGDGDCNTCGGYGEVERYAGGGDTVTSKCSSCYGSGNCRTCGGSGKR